MLAVGCISFVAHGLVVGVGQDSCVGEGGRKVKRRVEMQSNNMLGE